MDKTGKLKTIIISILITCLAFTLNSLVVACKAEKAEEAKEELEKPAKEMVEEEIAEEQLEEKEESAEKEIEKEVSEEPEEEAIYEIAFSSNHASPFSIFSCLPDGSNLKKIYDSAFDDHHPSWNSDHTKIVFSSNMDGDEDGDIFIYDVANDEISKVIDREGFDTVPIFSPDDKSIVFAGEVRDTEGGSEPNFEIFTVNIDGSNLKQLTNDPAIDIYPHYSPDGETIIFSHGEEFHKLKLFIMDLEGNNITQITNEGNWSDFDGTYSPDGKSIVFVSDRDGNEDIWVMPVDSPDQAVNLTNDPANDSYPDYSPDGNMIVFASDRDESEEYVTDIFVMTSSGENQTNITPDLKGSYESGPSW